MSVCVRHIELRSNLATHSLKVCGPDVLTAPFRGAEGHSPLPPSRYRPRPFLRSSRHSYEQLFADLLQVTLPFRSTCQWFGVPAPRAVSCIPDWHYCCGRNINVSNHCPKSVYSGPTTALPLPECGYIGKTTENSGCSSLQPFDYPVERWHRDAKIYDIFEGTEQIQQLVISRAISGMRIE